MSTTAPRCNVKTGNTIYVTTVTYLLDKTAPPSHTGQAASAWTNPNAEITFVTDDGLSGVADVQVTPGQNGGLSRQGEQFTADQNGAYLNTVADKAGNTETVAVAVRENPTRPTRR